MSGFSQRYRTLGELMSELRTRLGFVTQGLAAKGNDAAMKSFLQEAHDYVYGELEPPPERKKTIIRLSADSYLYDWHNDVDDEYITPGRVLALWLKQSETIRIRMTQGITEYDRALSHIRQYPSKYDHLGGQLEVYPIPDRDYDLIVDYIADQPRFERATDRPGVPDRLVFLYALARAKAHYRHPDAQAAAGGFQTMLNREKERQKEEKRFFATRMRPTGRPTQVTPTADGGYTLAT